jgi:hypothetical protein
MLGVMHQDLRLNNMLWNKEVGHVLIIDFHQSQIDHRPAEERVRSLKRPLSLQVGKLKQLCLIYT